MPRFRLKLVENILKGFCQQANVEINLILNEIYFSAINDNQKDKEPPSSWIFTIPSMLLVCMMLIWLNDSKLYIFKN